MTKAVFWIENGDYTGFEITGHSDYTVAGKDIVCAAISAMTMLTVNTICDVYLQKAFTETNDKTSAVSFKLVNKDKASVGLLKSFYEELVSLQKEYPVNLKVITENYRK
ncbi:MAG TPA: hypothetical protein DCP51_02840 [Clostridiales bacterium]|nr:hypothetical protein [Clostridiales bacterium]